ncbi:MAG: pitrilysin family protein [Gammaproteobacteria bacterium]|jgi:zinc protease
MLHSNRRRRKPFYTNIWWMLAIVITIGVCANYFFLSKKPEVAATSEPKQSAPHDNHLLNIQSWQTVQGLNTYFLPIENLPIVDIQLIFAAGSAYDGGKPGIAQLTNLLIGKDTQAMPTDVIVEKFESLGAIFDTHVSRDAASVTLRTLAFENERTEAVDLFTHIFSAADFKDESFSLEKQQLLTAIAAQNQSPQALANEAFYSAIYPAHPYGSPALGQTQYINAFTLDDVKRFYQRFYNVQNASLIITGDVTRDQAELIAENLSLALTQGEPAPKIPEVKLPAAEIFEHIDFPSTQNHILIGLPTIEKNNPDFFAFYIGNEIFGGGGLSSQLFEVVRMQEGLAYSVRSQVTPLQQKGPFIISLQTRNDSSDIAKALVLEHLQKFTDKGPTQNELKKAKQNIAGRFLMAFNSNAAIAQHVGTIAFYKLPLNYFDDYLAKINAVTVDDIKRVFNEYVGSKNLVTVTLGVDEQQD